MSRRTVGYLGLAAILSVMAGSLLLSPAALSALGGLRVFQTPSQDADPPPADKPARDAFAQDRDADSVKEIAFDGKRAMSYLQALCKIGPRISGTEGMKKQQELLKKHFEERAAKVEFQRFTARQQSQQNPVEMVNLVLSWHPERLRRVILCSHYDTRPIADQEADPRRWRQPFLSANDGGSGVALLMELANHVKELKTNIGIDFVLFDGEEYIFEPRHDKYFFGSEHFAQSYQRSRLKYRYVAAVLLDMIGGKNARFPVEQNSALSAGALVKDLWSIAAELKCATFQYREGPEVLDDHLALNKAGIPAVDIIDFEYRHWHLLSDVPENCSDESLKQVARVVSVWLQRVK